MSKIYTIIESGSIGTLSWREIWRYRELFWMLAWRNIVVRYKQTVFGLLWALGRPLATMAAFSVIFHRIAGLRGVSDVPYPMLVFSGVLIWQCFSGMVSAGGEALVANRGLVTKVYFPRVIIPVSGVIVCLVDFLLTLIVFAAAYCVWCRGVFSLRTALFPLTLLPMVLCALGLIFFFSALNVRYRDFCHVVPFLLQLGLFVSPVGYASAAIPVGAWRIAAALNPLYGVIGMARWSLFGIAIEPWAALTACVESLLVFFIGFVVFRKQEKGFSDYI